MIDKEVVKDLVLALLYITSWEEEGYDGTYHKNTEIWMEEKYDEYMASSYGFEYIAGYTDSGVPYGTPEKSEEINGPTYDYDDDEIPF